MKWKELNLRLTEIIAPPCVESKNPQLLASGFDRTHKQLRAYHLEYFRGLKSKLLVNSDARQMCAVSISLSTMVPDTLFTGTWLLDCIYGVGILQNRISGKAFFSWHLLPPIVIPTPSNSGIPRYRQHPLPLSIHCERYSVHS